MPELTHREILQKIIDYCVKDLGIKELGLRDIGRVHRQPSSYAEIFSEHRLPGIITYEVLKLFASYACRGHGFDAANYFAHFGRPTVLEDLRNMGLPEYGLEWLVRDTDYIGTRQDGSIPRCEDLLENSFSSLEKKYGKRKVKALKKRLGISGIIR